MTETVKSAFVSFAVCSVVGGMLEYLTPKKYRKTLRVTVVGVVLALCIVPAFGEHIDFNLNLDTQQDNEQLAYDSLMHTANLVEKKVRGQIKELLINEGVDEYEIYITTSVDKVESTIYLEEVVVEIGEKFGDKLPVINKKIPDEYKSIVRTGVKNE